MWKDIGGSITIHCRAAALPPQNLLSLKRGLHKDEIFTTNNDRRHNLVSKNVEGRLLVVGVFPDLDLIIGNLTMEETGLYRCFYSKTGRTIETKEGEGAVLLVVKGEPILYESPVNSGTIIRGLCCFPVHDECCVC